LQKTTKDIIRGDSDKLQKVGIKNSLRSIIANDGITEISDESYTESQEETTDLKGENIADNLGEDEDVTDDWEPYLADGKHLWENTESFNWEQHFADEQKAAKNKLIESGLKEEEITPEMVDTFIE